MGASVNAIIVDTITLLQLNEVRHTPIVLELVDKSIVKTIGVLEDVMVIVASWE